MTDVTQRAVLFDLDGTLLDTLEDIASAANAVLAQLEFPQHKLEAYKYFVGDGIEALATRILPPHQGDMAMIDMVVADIKGEYGQRWADTTHPYEGIPELLEALTARRIKMAILSNKPNEATKDMVSKLLPQWQFDVVLGASPGVPKKPDPSVALEIADRLNMPPSEFLYLGDTDTDMRTAKAAGMCPIGVLWGFRTAEELLASGAKVLIRKPTDLLDIL